MTNYIFIVEGLLNLIFAVAILTGIFSKKICRNVKGWSFLSCIFFVPAAVLITLGCNIPLNSWNFLFPIYSLFNIYFGLSFALSLSIEKLFEIKRKIRVKIEKRRMEKKIKEWRKLFLVNM